jgi:hypothetical protein
MSGSGSLQQLSRVPAVIAYLPVVGWAYVLIWQRKNLLAVYHLRQSIGLVLFLLAITGGWIVVAWLIAWIPYAFVVGIALFTLVIASYLFGVVAFCLGITHALNARLAPLPLFGRWANRLPIG